MGVNTEATAKRFLTDDRDRRAAFALFLAAVCVRECCSYYAKAHYTNAQWLSLQGMTACGEKKKKIARLAAMRLRLAVG